MLENFWIDITGHSLYLTIVLIVAAVAWIIQMVYLLVYFRRVGAYHDAPASTQTLAVSVVIAARNEYHHLLKNLPAILEQDYPSFEVVLVDDASDDETEEYLKELQLKYKHLNVVRIQSNLNFFRGKKFPLGLGIKAAKNEWMLLTDADCCPMGPQWIREMQGHFTNKTEVVLAYGAYTPAKGLLNKLIRWETVHTAMQYFSFALAGRPYMGVGRNLAYRKSLFNRGKGFLSHYHIASGDDDLFVNQNATKKNTTICLSPQSFTTSAPARSFGEWARQKRRHLTTGKYYKPGDKFLLAGWPISMVLFISLTIFLAVQLFNPAILGLMLLVRQVSFLVIFKKTMNKLTEKKLLLFSLWFELFFVFFFALLAFINVFSRTHKWK
jgi:cellulose synthase/poly-beta-1,6-N-acetylglucosamine synthase-like glycosyltransferase